MNMKQISLLVILLCGLSTAVGQTVRQPASKAARRSGAEPLAKSMPSLESIPKQTLSGKVLQWVGPNTVKVEYKVDRVQVTPIYLGNDGLRPPMQRGERVSEYEETVTSTVSFVATGSVKPGDRFNWIVCGNPRGGWSLLGPAVKPVEAGDITSPAPAE